MKRLVLYAVAPMLAAAAVWAADDQFGFMPDGGREILSRLAGDLDENTVRDLLTRDSEAEGWVEWARTRNAQLDETAARTMAEYAALNLPLDSKATAGLSADELTAVLPPDGKDLAIAQCQFCHSLFSGYLMHDRDRTGWESTFKAPFHTEIPMTEIERQTFASYSALNMPLKFEDVPPEWRF